MSDEQNIHRALKMLGKEMTRKRAYKPRAYRSLAAPAGSESRLNAGGLYRKFKSHVRCVGLHLKETKSGIELRCRSRTHGGNDVLLMKIPNARTEPPPTGDSGKPQTL